MCKILNFEKLITEKTFKELKEMLVIENLRLENYKFNSGLATNNDIILMGANIKVIEMCIEYRINLEKFESPEAEKYFK